MATWPGGAHGALCLSFDNLGEAAELELGAQPDAPGEHFTATRVLPELLETLAEHELAATFFVEGLNAELYPEALRSIAAAGHEVAYHAWRHEQWGELTADEQSQNLARGIEAFRGLHGDTGIAFTGLRPPGGQLGAGGLDVPRERGLRYCSPAGKGVGSADGVALLPFQWRHVDATCVLPTLGPVREQMTGSSDPVEPDAFLAYLETEIERLMDEGAFATFVLHLSMLDWLGEGRLGRLLDRVGEAVATDDLWAVPCAEVAAHVLLHHGTFRGGATLDPTSWAG